MEKNTIEVYGMVDRFTDIDERNYLITLIEDETNKEWSIRIPTNNLHWYLEDSKHFYVRGEMVGEELIAEYADRWGRYCDHCGKHHTEGWWVKEDSYACCDECAIALCNGDEEAFRAGIIVDENGDLADEAYTYWTEWE